MLIKQVKPFTNYRKVQHWVIFIKLILPMKCIKQLKRRKTNLQKENQQERSGMSGRTDFSVSGELCSSKQTHVSITCPPGFQKNRGHEAGQPKSAFENQIF